MIAETPMPETKAERQASEDAWELVRCEQSKVKAKEIRANPKRFAAAVKHLKKENEERRKAMQKENTAREKAVKK